MIFFISEEAGGPGVENSRLYIPLYIYQEGGYRLGKCLQEEQPWEMGLLSIPALLFVNTKILKSELVYIKGSTLAWG
ncbi:hypothetical protein [Anaplasma marginale]|uniref:hypothetical protein n=1 Tax=Anaplasma marginale TaxID=770 RepID=UPI00223B23E6|nr:hypothetical protein [Anaplasma marginale]